MFGGIKDWGGWLVVLKCWGGQWQISKKQEQKSAANLGWGG